MWKFIVIEWVDWSWKATQTKLLAENLEKLKYKVTTLSFPMYWHRWATFVEKFLNGEFWKLEEIDPYIASTFYTLDRFAHKNEIITAIKNNDFVISDRYSISNFIHRGSYFLQKWKKHEIKNFFDRIFDLEFNKANLPKPDIIIFLSLSIENIQKLLTKKATQKREYIASWKLDQAEKDLIHQKYSLEVWKNFLKNWFPNTIIINCEDKNWNILPPQQISNTILNHILNLWK